MGAIRRWLTGTSPITEDAKFTLTLLYSNTLKPDPKVVKAREKKLASIKAEMGDKYLLATNKGRLNATH